MARLSRSFVNDTLWPEFLELQATLAAYFDALTDRVIEQALEVKASEAEEGGEEWGEEGTPSPPRCPSWNRWSASPHCCEQALRGSGELNAQPEDSVLAAQEFSALQ